MKLIRSVLTGLAVVLAACAAPAGGADPAAGPTAAPAAPVLAPGAVRWTVATQPELDLWYHGLAYTGLGEAGEIPVYAPGYLEEMERAKRAAGVYPTVLDRRREEFRALFQGDERLAALQFLPLYFERGEDFFAALRLWIQSGGDARRVQNQALAPAVAFLSRQLPTAQHRRAVASWLEVLEEENRTFYDPHRQSRQAELARTAAAVQAEWERIAPRVAPMLDYLMLNQGELVLSPPIGSEGRTLDLGRRNNRVATGVPDSARPADAVWAFLHELMYPYVATVLDDQLSPAQRRAADEALLSRRAAIRAGAILLDRVAPAEAPAYRAAYLRWAGAPVPAGAVGLHDAFEREYPLPDPVPAALEEGITGILRGI